MRTVPNADDERFNRADRNIAGRLSEIVKPRG